MFGSIFKTLRERKQWEKPENEADVIGANGGKTFHTVYPPYPSAEIARLQASFKWGGLSSTPCMGELVLRKDCIHFAMYDNEMSLAHSFSRCTEGDIRRATETMMRWKIALRDLEDIEIHSGWLQTKLLVRSALGDTEPNEETREFPGVSKLEHAREFRRLALAAKAALPPESDSANGPVPLELVTRKMVPFFQVFKGPKVKDSVDVIVTKDPEGIWIARVFTMCDDKGYVTRFTYYLIPAEPSKAIVFLYLGERNGEAFARFDTSVNLSNAKSVGKTWPKLVLAWTRGKEEQVSDPEVPALIQLTVPTQRNVWGLASLVDNVDVDNLGKIDPDGADRPDVVARAETVAKYALDMLVEFEENDLPETLLSLFANAYAMWKERSKAEKWASLLGGFLGVRGQG